MSALDQAPRQPANRAEIAERDGPRPNHVGRGPLAHGSQHWLIETLG
jgi:hypothetical protein